MATAGYVLAGGASSRMGRNKAFLGLGDRTLIEIALTAVQEAAGSVTIIGPVETYGTLGFPVASDLRTNAGPLAGIETALSHTTADWNLIVACDMPRLTAAKLRRIIAEALVHDEVGCVLPETADGFVEPLCAAYHKRILPDISRALTAGTRKITDALVRVQVHYIRMTKDPAFQNVNTPDEWRKAQDDQG